MSRLLTWNPGNLCSKYKIFIVLNKGILTKGRGSRWFVCKSACCHPEDLNFLLKTHGGKGRKERSEIWCLLSSFVKCLLLQISV